MGVEMPENYVHAYVTGYTLELYGRVNCQVVDGITYDLVCTWPGKDPADIPDSKFMPIVQAHVIRAHVCAECGRSVRLRGCSVGTKKAPKWSRNWTEDVSVWIHMDGTPVCPKQDGSPGDIVYSEVEYV